MYDYDKEFVIPPKVVFEVFPGNMKITKGDDLSIKVKVSGNERSEINFYTKSSDQSGFTSRDFYLNENNEFTYELRNVSREFIYYFECEDEQSDKYTIEVINRPFVKGLKAIITPPRYSGLEQSVQLDNGSVYALKGSRIDINAYSSKPVTSAVLKFTDKQIPLEIDKNTLSASFNLLKNDTYEIELLDNDNIRSNNQVEYSLSMFEDNFPTIEILSPEDELRIATDRIPISVSIGDDFGFSDLTLHIRLSASYYSSPETEFRIFDSITINKTELEQDVYYVWDISDLYLAEGDVVSYYLEVKDNDTVSGPKSVKSNIQTIMVPSMNEFFDEADQTQELAQEELTKTLQEANELKTEIENLSNQLKRNEKTLSYEEKEKLENAIEKFEQLSEKATDAAEKLNEMQNNLMENNLLSPETMQKYSDLQDLMEELKGSDALEAIRKMQQEMENLLRNNAQRNLDQMKLDENAFQESLERTINLLKRIQVEQKIDEMIKRTEQLSEKLKELDDKLQFGDKQELDKRQERSARK